MRERIPASQTVIDGLRSCTALWHARSLRHQPGVQRVGDGFGLLLTNDAPLVVVQLLDRPLNIVQRAEQLERLLGNLAAVIGPELMKLAS